MSDQPSDTSTTAATGAATAVADPNASTATTDPIATDQSDSDGLGEKGKAALAAERKRANEAERANKDLQKRLKAVEDRDLSELDKAKRDAAEATERANRFERERMQAKVALEKGVPAGLADRLRGDTETEMAADADTLLADVKRTTTGTPKPDRSQGSAGSNDAALNGDPLLRDLKHKLNIA